MTTVQKIILVGLFLFIAVGILYPNPFSNNPDIIGDESYFLTSALSSIEKHTLPGWEFSQSGSYYGGPQTYVDTVVLVPVLGVILAASHFSMTAAKVWVALNTGTLLHILRLVNGAAALLTILFSFLYFKKRKIPHELALMLALFLFLVLSNVLTIEFFHTAKMWTLYVLLVSVTSALFLAQEYYLSRLKTHFISTERYVAFLIWTAILTFFQSLVGVFSIAFFVLYALILNHFTIRDLWKYVLKYWYLFVLFALTQISFIYRGYSMFAAGTFADAATKTAAGSVDWYARFAHPLVNTIQSQPLSILYLVALASVAVLVVRNRTVFSHQRTRAYIAIASVHPVLTYLFFHVVVGLERLPRYAIILTLACALSTVMLFGELGRKWLIGGLVAAFALFVVVNVHAIELYWHQSSETDLLQTIESHYNSPTTVFITDHSARRMTLPVNYDSLLLLNEKRQDMSRFSFLLQHQDQLPKDDSFKPLTVTAYLDEEMSAALQQFSARTYSVWVISKDCTHACTAQEMQSGTCFQVHTSACGLEPQEVNTFPVFLAADQLGYSYIVRKVH